jgi:hypothetical protein
LLQDLRFLQQQQQQQQQLLRKEAARPASAGADAWGDADWVAVEARLLLHTAPPLCLEPTPLVLAVNAAAHYRRHWPALTLGDTCRRRRAAAAATAASSRDHDDGAGAPLKADPARFRGPVHPMRDFIRRFGRCVRECRPSYGCGLAAEGRPLAGAGA